MADAQSNTALEAGKNHPSALDKMKEWWRSKRGTQDEHEPLLGNSDRGGKPSAAVKITLATIAGILVLLGLGGIALCLFTSSDEPSKESWPDEVPTFCAYAIVNVVAESPHPLSDIEKLFLQLPSNDSISGYLKYYSSEAHLAGSERDKRTAEFTRDKFIEYGITNTTIETYWPLLNYPVSHKFRIVSGPEELRYEASLREDPIEEDEVTLDPDVVPSFHGYSKNGTANGPVVYANYGRLEDFQYLVDQGINLAGTIALMRYGQVARGLQVRAAATFGCVGALIFSDPKDDGPLNKEGYPHVNPAKAYPEGPWRPASSVQRGSVSYLSLSSGDPLTPGYAATKDAPRLKMEDVTSLPTIPSLPLSYRDALPILKATQGRGVNTGDDWKGGLEEVEYFSGPTEGEAYLENIVDYKITPLWNVISVIEGSVEPDRVIVLGNHRDAWVYGAADPSSGSATMLEIARAFGEMLKTGWRPARTIVFGSWDGEEYGLVGSTEWVEDKKEWLSKGGVAYINVDVAVAGSNLDVDASPSLSQLIYDVTSLVSDPNTNGSVYDSWATYTNHTYKPSSTPHVGDLGSGSDFVPFLQHVGIASVSMDFNGDYGVYHSNYDSYHWMETFGDRGFHYHVAMAKIWGLIALRLADSPVLPIRPSDYAESLTDNVEDITNYAGRVLKANDNERFQTLTKAVEDLNNVAKTFQQSVGSLEREFRQYSHLDQVPESLRNKLSVVNDQVTFFERGLLDPEGIQNREWFKHVVYAPGYWTGYSAQVFTAIADALDSADSELVTHKEKRAAQCIQNTVNILNGEYEH